MVPVANGATRTYTFRIYLRSGNTFVLTDSVGTHWRLLFDGCPRSRPDCEMRVNVRGGGTNAPPDSSPGQVGDQPVDIGFTIVSASVLRAKCLRPSCVIQYTKNKRTSLKRELRRGERIDVPVDAVVTLWFKSR